MLARASSLTAEAALGGIGADGALCGRLADDDRKGGGPFSGEGVIGGAVMARSLFAGMLFGGSSVNEIGTGPTDIDRSCSNMP